jgi:hypothetical protein
LKAHLTALLLLTCAGLVAWFGFAVGGLLASFAGYGELAFLFSVLGAFAGLSMLERLFGRLRSVMQ